MKYILPVVFFTLITCTYKTPEEKSIESVIGKEINLEMYRTILYYGDTIPFGIFRNKYEYLSLVYLQNNCMPCYEKYILWNRRMDTLSSNKHTVLFIIIGRSVNDFLNEVKLKEDIEMKYFIKMDPNFNFLRGNQEIPKWIIEQSLLIDEENKIKLVGQPFLNPELSKQFMNIISN